jgi:hypothetical protein
MRTITIRTFLIAVVAVAVVAVSGTAIAASTGAAGSPSSFLDSLAQHLGISRERLDTAAKAAALDQVDAALKAGTITQAQADAMKQRIESGEGLFFGMGPGFGRHGHDGPHGFGDPLAAAAAFLGLEEDELRDQLRDGKSLADVAKAKGKSVDGLKQAILADAKERVAAAVKDGKLTEAQASEILERLEEHLDDLVAGTAHRGFGRRGFGGGPGLRGPPSGMRDAPDFGSAGLAPAWGAPA